MPSTSSMSRAARCHRHAARVSARLSKLHRPFSFAVHGTAKPVGQQSLDPDDKPGDDSALRAEFAALRGRHKSATRSQRAILEMGWKMRMQARSQYAIARISQVDAVMCGCSRGIADSRNKGIDTSARTTISVSEGKYHELSPRSSRARDTVAHVTPNGDTAAEMSACAGRSRANSVQVLQRRTQGRVSVLSRHVRDASRRHALLLRHRLSDLSSLQRRGVRRCHTGTDV